VEGTQKEQLYANALFSFMPSHTENFGNVAVESLAQGTPVAASTGTPWQLLEEKQAGFWTDNTPSVLAAVIDKILALSPEEYALYRQNAYTLATEQFDVHKNINQWIDAYKNILNES
jgi:glycosyltransferase involved in cell wall biosynthesis